MQTVAEPNDFTPQDRMLLGTIGWISLAVGTVFLFRAPWLIVKLAAGVPLVLAGGFICWLAAIGRPVDFGDDNETTSLMAFERLYLVPLSLLSLYGGLRLITSNVTWSIRLVLSIMLFASAAIMIALILGRMELPDVYSIDEPPVVITPPPDPDDD